MKKSKIMSLVGLILRAALFGASFFPVAAQTQSNSAPVANGTLFSSADEDAETNEILRLRDSASSNALVEAHILSRQSYHSKSRSEVNRDFASFLRLIPVAATNTVLNGNTPEDAVFLRVMKEASAHRAQLEEIFITYGQWHGGYPRPRILQPPELKSDHATEGYRSVWEALLLAPPSDEIEFMHNRLIITEALSRIGNPASIPVLEIAFASTCDDSVYAGEGTSVLERQFRIMECLNRLATRESLEAMFRCLTQAEAHSHDPLPQYSGYNLREWVARFLVDDDNYKTKEKWRQIVNAFPAANLPADQRKLLDTARLHLNSESFESTLTQQFAGYGRIGNVDRCI